MTDSEKTKFPGGSKALVNKAGDNIRNGVNSSNDISVIEEWRASHRAVLNTFQAILRARTKHKEIIVGQRHKRRSTIFDKLTRHPKMQLSRMDDVAGCRLIFNTINELYEFRFEFHKARFKHKLRNEIDKYDYIKHPKETGYRGIHDVYEYNVRSKTGKYLTGLLVELQYRTVVQHAWATAVEIIGFITESQPKFQKGDKRYEYAMSLASEILARAFENSKGPYPLLSNHDLVEKFVTIDKELGLLKMLKGLNSANNEIIKNKNSILILSNQNDLQIKSYKDAPEALRALFELEKTLPGYDIVLVRGPTSDDIRLVYKNYFSDARDFIKFIEDGCANLLTKKKKM